MYTVEDCKKDLIDALEKIMSGETNIDTSKYSDLEIELIELKFGYSFVLYINNERFGVDFYTPIETAEYIFENIEKISYIISDTNCFDTLVGDIHEFIVNDLGFKECSDNYFKAMQYYRHCVRYSNTDPTLENIATHIKELLYNEIKDTRIQ